LPIPLAPPATLDDNALPALLPCRVEEALCAALHLPGNYPTPIFRTATPVVEDVDVVASLYRASQHGAKNALLAHTPDLRHHCSLPI